MRLFINIVRDPRWTQEEFLDWWSNQHAELAKLLPGIGRYVLHEVTGGFEKDVPYHGLAELEFESLEAARSAFASPEGKALLDDAVGVRGSRMIMVTEQYRVVREGFDD